MSRFKETLKDTPNGNTSLHIFSFVVGTSGELAAALFTYIACWEPTSKMGYETGIHLGQWVFFSREETLRDVEIPMK